ncbi:MAG: DUF11 domain-containing protein [Phycisphaeraceae bacterium]|nr:DUF11 domain-containing protein [Phycisphaerales bacterium]MCB9842088.1 DUF11 domain-containing protein [Phycisphaeraceae bacterium]
MFSVVRRMSFLGFAAAGLVALAGCRHDHFGHGHGDHGDDVAHHEETAKPAPAPAPAPAMMSGNVASMYFPTGDRATSALLLEQVMPREVRMGESYDYEIRVTNITRGVLQNVVVTGDSMDNLSVASSSPSATRSPSGGMQWGLGDLAPGETKVIKVSGKADRVGVSSACVSVSYNNALCATTNVVQPALALVKEMSPANMTPCDTAQVVFTVKNTGTGFARAVKVRDELPAGMTTMDGKSVIELDVPDIGPGQAQVSPAIPVKISKPGRYSNNASASAAGGLSAESNTVAVTVVQPVLEIAVECPGNRYIGRPIEYTVTVRNTGDGDCSDARVSASMPAGAAFVSATDGGSSAGGSVNWNVGSLKAGASKKVSFTVNPAGAGNYRSEAVVNCACATEARDACSTEVTGIPAILVEVVDNPDPIEIGGTVTYTIRVTNQGSANDNDIKVVCELPGEESFVSAGGATAGTLSGKTITFAPLGTLAPKAVATWTVVAKADAEGDVRFATAVTSREKTTPIRETESTTLYR